MITYPRQPQEQGPDSSKLAFKEIFFQIKYAKKIRKLYVPLDREIPLTGKFNLETSS